MPSLTDKLEELGVHIGTSKLKSPSDDPPSPSSLIDFFPGTWESNSQGDCFVIRKNIPLGTTHGQIQLSGHPDMNFFDSLDHLQGITDVSPEEYLFIDTETTGLSGGVGTYVFLVGAAKYSKDSLDFAQFFLQDPANESAQLSALEEFAATTKTIISYNGKSFDLPRIRTRYRYHGWPDPFHNILHLDLLHFVRRIWKTLLPSCTLGDIERHIIGLDRDNLDIPGWKVSENFYQYLSTQDPTPLESIFYHNEVDVISLAALLEYLASRLSAPLENPGKNMNDLLAIGEYYFSLRHFENAKQILSAALTYPDYSKERLLIGKLCLAATNKKMGDYSSAAAIWMECSEMGSLEASIELAKHAEHNLADYENAIHWTLTAFDSLETLPRSNHLDLTKQLDHRLQRLKSKAQR